MLCLQFIPCSKPVNRQMVHKPSGNVTDLLPDGMYNGSFGQNTKFVCGPSHRQHLQHFLLSLGRMSSLLAVDLFPCGDKGAFCANETFGLVSGFCFAPDVPDFDFAPAESGFGAACLVGLESLSGSVLLLCICTLATSY